MATIFILWALKVGVTPTCSFAPHSFIHSFIFTIKIKGMTTSSKLKQCITVQYNYEVTKQVLYSTAF